MLALVSLESRPGRAAAERATLPERSPSIETWSARELRALPGLGEKRAVAIVRARWEGTADGTVGSLDRVPGIGEGTVTALREELELLRERATPETRALPRIEDHTTDATSAEEDE